MRIFETMTLDLLKLEWLKYRRYKTFWVLTLLFFGFLAGFYGMIASGFLSINPGGVPLVERARNFATIWSDLGFYASYFIIILSILVIILNGNEIQFRTNRQNVIDGLSRLQFYHMKWGIVILLSAACTVFVIVYGSLTGMLTGAGFNRYFHHFERNLWLFLVCLNYLGFALCLSVLVKRSGLAIGLLMFYSMVIESMLHLLFLFNFQAPALDLLLPLQVSDELLPASSAEFLKFGLTDAWVPGKWLYAGVTCCWILLYYFAGRSRIVSKDW